MDDFGVMNQACNQFRKLSDRPRAAGAKRENQEPLCSGRPALCCPPPGASGKIITPPNRRSRLAEVETGEQL